MIWLLKAFEANPVIAVVPAIFVVLFAVIIVAAIFDLE